MTLVKRLILILALTVSATAREKESVIERLTRLGYDQLPKTLNAILDKKEYRLPTELECWFSPALPTVPLKKNACYYYLKAAYATPPSQTAPPGSYSALEPYDGDIDRFEAWVNKYKPVQTYLKQAETLSDFEVPPLSLAEITPFSLATNQRADTALSSKFRNLGRFLCDRAFAYEERGEIDKAFKSYLQVVKVGSQLMKSNDAAIIVLIGNALVQMGADGVESLAGTHKLNDAQLQAAQATVQQLPDIYPKLVRLHAREIRLQAEFFLDKTRLQKWIAYVEPLMRRALEHERKKALERERKRSRKPNSESELLLRAFDEYGHGLDDSAAKLLEGYKKQLKASDADRRAFEAFFKRETLPEFKRAESLTPAVAEKHYADKQKATWTEIRNAFPALEDNEILKTMTEGAEVDMFKKLLITKEQKKTAEKMAQEIGEKWAATVPKDQQLPIVMRWQFGLSTCPMISSYGRRGARVGVLKDCLNTKLALERYYLKAKRYPKSLNALVPAFLEAIPMDPYSAKPLVYKSDGKNWLLYSIGRNRKDDGGTTIGERSAWPVDDIGLRSFSATASQRRRELSALLYQLHKEGVQPSSVKPARFRDNGFVIYRHSWNRGIWIKKDVALARQARDKKTRPNRR